MQAVRRDVQRDDGYRALPHPPHLVRVGGLSRDLDDAEAYTGRIRHCPTLPRHREGFPCVPNSFSRISNRCISSMSPSAPTTLLSPSRSNDAAPAVPCVTAVAGEFIRATTAPSPTCRSVAGASCSPCESAASAVLPRHVHGRSSLSDCPTLPHPSRVGACLWITHWSGLALPSAARLVRVWSGASGCLGVLILCWG
jgi:hypothetical protein